MVRHYYKKRYRIQDKKYYQKLLNFDNTVRERYCYDDYLLTPVSEILGVDNNTIKKCVEIYYDIVMKKMETEHKSIGSLLNDYVYIVSNKNDVNVTKHYKNLLIVHYMNEARKCNYISHRYITNYRR